jgi:hypothetical protein
MGAARRIALATPVYAAENPLPQGTRRFQRDRRAFIGFHPDAGLHPVP